MQGILLKLNFECRKFKRKNNLHFYVFYFLFHFHLGIGGKHDIQLQKYCLKHSCLIIIECSWNFQLWWDRFFNEIKLEAFIIEFSEKNIF